MPVSGNSGFTWSSATTQAITSADTYESDVLTIGADSRGAQVQVKFAVGTKGTNAVCHIQTSIDGGTTWGDVASGALGTESGNTETMMTVLRTASMAGDDRAVLELFEAETSNIVFPDGILGDRLRIKLVTTGNYVSTTLSAHCKWDREDVS